MTSHQGICGPADDIYEPQGRKEDSCHFIMTVLCGNCFLYFFNSNKVFDFPEYMILDSCIFKFCFWCIFTRAFLKELRLLGFSSFFPTSTQIKSWYLGYYMSRYSNGKYTSFFSLFFTYKTIWYIDLFCFCLFFFHLLTIDFALFLFWYQHLNPHRFFIYNY